VLVGGGSDTELSLPYLAFVEAIGNYLDGVDPDCTVSAAAARVFAR
jgi:hypothetical protein